MLLNIRLPAWVVLSVINTLGFCRINMYKFGIKFTDKLFNFAYIFLRCDNISIVPITFTALYLIIYHITNCKCNIEVWLVIFVQFICSTECGADMVKVEDQIT